MLTSSASLKEKRESSVAMVATRDTLARDWPTQLRGPSAKGKYRFGRLLSPAHPQHHLTRAALPAMPGAALPVNSAIQSNGGIGTGGKCVCSLSVVLCIYDFRDSLSSVVRASALLAELGWLVARSRSQFLYHSLGRGSFSITAYSVPGVSHRSAHQTSLNYSYMRCMVHGTQPDCPVIFPHLRQIGRLGCVCACETRPLRSPGINFSGSSQLKEAFWMAWCGTQIQVPAGICRRSARVMSWLLLMRTCPMPTGGYIRRVSCMIRTALSERSRVSFSVASDKKKPQKDCLGQQSAAVMRMLTVGS